MAKTRTVEENETYDPSADSEGGVPTEVAATNGAPARRTESVQVELKDEYAEAPDAWEHETLADRIKAARQLLIDHGIITQMEDRKVRSRMRNAFYGGFQF